MIRIRGSTWVSVGLLIRGCNCDVNLRQAQSGASITITDFLFCGSWNNNY